MNQKFLDLIEFINSLEPDVEKFYTKGQSAAGTRLRKGLSDLKKKAQDLRNDIQTVKADRKTAKDGN
ncbi:MAG: histone H1 [Bacteroidota bacterium]